MQRDSHKQIPYWERAGRAGYDKAMFGGENVASHIQNASFHYLAQAAKAVGLGSGSSVLELGCGDGAFAEAVLSKQYAEILGIDLAGSAVERANQRGLPNCRFEVDDITQRVFPVEKKWDGVFLVGIIHHIKPSVEKLIEQLSAVTGKIVLLEPNGNHLGRKLLEKLPSYKDAGEDSFRWQEIIELFSKAGWTCTYHRRFNLFPNQTPPWVYRVLRPLEPWIEANEQLSKLCTAQVMSFQKGSK